MTTERSRHLAADPARLPTGDPHTHPAHPGRPRGRPSHCSTTSDDDSQVQADASAGPALPASASIARFRLGQTTSRLWTRQATTPTPAIPAMRLPAPPPPSTTSRRTQRTRERMDTGRQHWTPDAWTLRCPHRTLDSGRVDGHAWTLDARTGHWTPDAGRGRGHGDEGTAGIRTSWPLRPAAARWDAQPCSCGTAPR
jgi:hypothetical protein